MKKRIVSALMALLMALSLVPMTVFADTVANGTCGASGSNLTWTLDDEGTLTISGTGEMKDYYDAPVQDSHSAPWRRFNVRSVVIKPGVTSIGNCAFAGCRDLEYMNIPDGIISIGRYVFIGCSGLTKVTISDGVTSIGNGAFSDCSSLAGIWVDSGNTAYSSDANGVLFNKDKTELIQCPAKLSGAYTIPDSVMSIGDYAFYNCSSLTSVTIPDGLTYIGEEAFYGCSGLVSVTIPDGVTSIGRYTFRDCSSLTSVTIPDGLTYIGEEAFYGCSGLTSVTVPNSVTSIGDYAFAWCNSLTSVTIPASVTSIGEYAFGGCDSLQTVYYGGTQTQWNAISIGSLNDFLRNATIHYNHIHQFIQSTVVKPTCTEPGYTEHLCAYGETLRDSYTAPLGHIHAANDQGVVTAPTCAEQGYTTYTCTRCGESYQTNFVDALPHDYKAVVTSPTCTEQGYTTYTCSHCGYSYTDDYTDVAGHHIVVDTAVEATCGEAGHTVGSHCDRCGEVFITPEVIPATGEHHFVDGKCEVCGCSAVLLGDVDGNGKVNMVDVTKIRQYLTNKTKYPLAVEAAADVDNSGKITMADVTKIRQYLTNKDKYPLG